MVQKLQAFMSVANLGTHTLQMVGVRMTSLPVFGNVWLLKIGFSGFTHNQGLVFHDGVPGPTRLILNTQWNPFSVLGF